MRGATKILTSFCGVLAATLLLHAAYAGGEIVARVTDLSGQVFDATDGAKKELRILTRLQAGSVLELSTDSNLTIYFSSNNSDLRFFGPATVTVSAQTASSSNGISATKEHKDVNISIDLNDSESMKISSSHSDMDNTGITPIQPVDTKIIADQPVEFRWEPNQANIYSYAFKLFDDQGGLVYSAITSSNAIRFTDEALFQPGRDYQWSVRSVSAGNASSPAVSQFAIASAEEANTYYDLASLTRGTVSDLVLYALALDQLDLLVESARVWQQLESHHPGIRQER